MKRGSFFCAGWWPFLVFPLLLLLPLTLFFKWTPIEEKVAFNAEAALQQAGFSWAKVETFRRGRELLLSGNAPSQEAVDRAIDIAAKADGVNSVEFDQASSRIEPPAPAELKLIVTANAVVVRGVVSDQETVNLILEQAHKVFGATNVVDKLVIGENTGDLRDIDGVFEALYGVGELGPVSASLDRDKVSVKGQVLTTDIKTSIQRELSAIFEDAVENQLTVATPTPVERDICEDLVNELLASGKINFQSGKATIAAQSNELLDSLAATAKQCPDASFEVSGHTDSVGNLAFNMKLSEQRAKAVVEYLVEQNGLDPSRFSAVGYGPQYPLGSDETEQGRAQNRRIEFKLKN